MSANLAAQAKCIGISKRQKQKIGMGIKIQINKNMTSLSC